MCTHFVVTKGMKLMADTYIKYNDHSISSAFKDHYIVPDYQREYVWTDEQVEQLMADLLDAYNADNKKAYFLGTIVTYDSGSQFELIDGQQRLTTFFVLLCAIKKFYVNCGEQTSVIENLIYSPTMNSEGDVINLYHLQLQYEDAGNCLELIEKGQERPNYLTQSGERLFDAFKTIQDFLSERFPDIASLKKFVVFLLNKTSFIRIETYDISDALKIFETINQRGKGLDPMDLLIHVDYKHECSATISLYDGKMVDGDMPRRVMKRASKKIMDNQRYLMECWNKLTDGLRIDLNVYFGVTPLKL